MIPEVFIENWRKTVPWQMTEQIEQDFLLGSKGLQISLLTK